jgi:hypothetical protein
MGDAPNFSGIIRGWGPRFDFHSLSTELRQKIIGKNIVPLLPYMAASTELRQKIIGKNIVPP